MDVNLVVHVEAADTDTGVAWWGESPEVPGFYAVGDTLAELRQVALAALADEVGQHALHVTERLMPSGDDVPSDKQSRQEFVESHLTGV